MDASNQIADEWQVSEGLYEGALLVTSFRTGARHLVGSTSYPIRIGVAVPLRDPGSDGMPTVDELHQLTSFEDALVSLMAGRAILVGVITTRGMREFVLYTGAGEWIEGFHLDLIAALPTHKVQMMARMDSDWSVYRQFVSSERV